MKPGMVGGGHLTAALRQGPVGGMRSDPVTPRIRRRTMPAAKIFCAQIRAPDTRRATKIFSQPHPHAGRAATGYSRGPRSYPQAPVIHLCPSMH
ncbi:hypothetical protein AL036_09695 [Salipiger aestuarii]|nr:hypothetical protein AL036_09695 [Salipiger aestuarii]